MFQKTSRESRRLKTEMFKTETMSLLSNLLTSRIHWMNGEALALSSVHDLSQVALRLCVCVSVQCLEMFHVICPSYKLKLWCCWLVLSGLADISAMVQSCVSVIPVLICGNKCAAVQAWRQKSDPVVPNRPIQWVYMVTRFRTTDNSMCILCNHITISKYNKVSMSLPCLRLMAVEGHIC